MNLIALEQGFNPIYKSLIDYVLSCEKKFNTLRTTIGIWPYLSFVLTFQEKFEHKN